MDTLASNTFAQSVPELSLNPLHPHRYRTLYDTIQRFQPDPNTLYSLLQPAIPPNQSLYCFAIDTTPYSRPYAYTFKDRAIVYQPTPIKGNKPITIGHEYSLLCLLLPREAKQPIWTLPLHAQRVLSDHSAQSIACEQIQHLLQRPPFQHALNLFVADVKEILSRPNGTCVAQRIGAPGDFAPPHFYDLEKGIDASLSGATSHTADGTMVYFHSIRSTNIGYQQKPPTDDILDIYVAKVVNGKPQAGVNLGLSINSVYPDGEPFITPDGKTLYFASKCPDGLGQNDIYVSHRTERGWSEPKNIRAPVNSPRNDLQPAFAFNDLKTMYFAFDRDAKIGMAIYRSAQRNDGSWSNPELVIKGLVGEPTLTADGALLYFVHILSDAKGIFDADVWYVRRKKTD